MLGSGIFVLPGLAMAKTGPSVWIAYLLASLCVLPAALSKAELATAMPTAGGTYVYVERAFGPLVGAIAGFVKYYFIRFVRIGKTPSPCDKFTVYATQPRS